MTSQCDPAKLSILEADLIEHFQLPQCCINSLSGAVSSPDGRFVASLTITDHDEFNRSRFMRLSSELLPNLEEPQLEVLKDLCHAAHRSEEFFVTDATNQWLRTAINLTDRAPVGSLFSQTLSKDERQRNTVIHSNVLPYDPYWTRSSLERDESSRRVHLIPCCIFTEVVQAERNTLMRKLLGWTQENCRREECGIGKHIQLAASKKVWEINPLARVVGKVIAPRLDPNEVQVSQVTWRGGNFIEKDIKNPEEFAAEVNVMETLCHPHIVYIFGINYIEEQQGSLYMECMESDLHALIIEKSARPEGGGKGPPFSHYNSVDILLQIANAMVHMHENKVIHGDLKSPNILVSPFQISERPMRYHYLAKVADFGSAKVKVDSKLPFIPSPGTTHYAAPEVLEFRVKKDKVISVPENIDVYSFGLVAFEVLTGKIMKHIYKKMSPREVKEGVMRGALKPPLQTECNENRFPYCKTLVALIERCWDENSERPSFSKIVKELTSVRDELQKAAFPSDSPRSEVTLVDGVNSSAHEQPASLRFDPPNQASFADDDHLDPAEGAASRSNGQHPTSPDHVNTISVAPHAQVPPPPRRQKRRGKLLQILLRPFSCVSGGNVQDGLEAYYRGRY